MLNWLRHPDAPIPFLFLCSPPSTSLSRPDSCFDISYVHFSIVPTLVQILITSHLDEPPPPTSTLLSPFNLPGMLLRFVLEWLSLPCLVLGVSFKLLWDGLPCPPFQRRFSSLYFLHNVIHSIHLMLAVCGLSALVTYTCACLTPPINFKDIRVENCIICFFKKIFMFIYFRGGRERETETETETETE